MTRCVLCCLDEFQDLLKTGARDRQAIVQMIKRLANKADFPICISGSEDSVTVLMDEPHMHARFRTKIKREKWENDDDFFTFLYGCVSRFPLKHPSMIFDPECRATIVSASNGNTEVIIGALAECARDALRRRIKAVAAGKEPDETMERIDRQLLIRLVS